MADRRARALHPDRLPAVERSLRAIARRPGAAHPPRRTAVDLVTGRPAAEIEP